MELSVLTPLCKELGSCHSHPYEEEKGGGGRRRGGGRGGWGTGGRGRRQQQTENHDFPWPWKGMKVSRQTGNLEMEDICLLGGEASGAIDCGKPKW